MVPAQSSGVVGSANKDASTIVVDDGAILDEEFHPRLFVNLNRLLSAAVNFVVAQNGVRAVFGPKVGHRVERRRELLVVVGDIAGQNHEVRRELFRLFQGAFDLVDADEEPEVDVGHLQNFEAIEAGVESGHRDVDVANDRAKGGRHGSNRSCERRRGWHRARRFHQQCPPARDRPLRIDGLAFALAEKTVDAERERPQWRREKDEHRADQNRCDKKESKAAKVTVSAGDRPRPKAESDGVEHGNDDGRFLDESIPRHRKSLCQRKEGDPGRNGNENGGGDQAVHKRKHGYREPSRQLLFCRGQTLYIRARMRTLDRLFAPPRPSPGLCLRRWARVFVWGMVAVAASLVPAVGCRSSSNAPLPAIPDVTEGLIREVRVALNYLPPVEAESFREFLPRARAAMLLADSADVRAAARRIPEDPVLFFGGPPRAFFPVLFAEWAMRRGRQNRVALLSSLVKMRTDGLHDDPTRAGARRRKDGKPYPPDPRRFVAQLRAQALSLGLRFKVTDDSILEVGQILRNQAAPKLALSTVLLARGDTPPLTSDAGWERAPFSGEIENGSVHGRGAFLAKGPLVAALYAVDALVDSGVPVARPPLLLVDMTAENSSPRLRQALRVKPKEGQPPSDQDALARFFEARGRPARVFATDSHLHSNGKAAGWFRLRLTSAISPFGPGTEDRYRLVVVDAEAAPHVLPGEASAMFLIPDSRLQSSGNEVPQALHRLFPSLAFVRQGRAVRLELKQAPGAAYALNGPRGATEALATTLSTLQGNGMLASEGCAKLLVDLHQQAQKLEAATPVRMGHLSIDDDGRCSVDVTVYFESEVHKESPLETLRALGTGDAEILDSRPPTATKANKVLRATSDEALAAYAAAISKNTLWNGQGTRDTLLRQTAKGIGLGPFADLETPRADVPGEFMDLDTLDALVAIYAYALASAGQ